MYRSRERRGNHRFILTDCNKSCLFTAAVCECKDKVWMDIHKHVLEMPQLILFAYLFTCLSSKMSYCDNAAVTNNVVGGLEISP